MIDELITVIRILEDEWMTINEALIKLQKQGFNLKEDKAVFILKDGALEIYFDEDENTLKTEIHDRKVFVSDSLNEMNMMNMMGVLLSGVKEEDEWMATVIEFTKELMAQIIEQLIEDTGMKSIATIEAEQLEECLKMTNNIHLVCLTKEAFADFKMNLENSTLDLQTEVDDLLLDLQLENNELRAENERMRIKLEAIEKIISN